MRKKAEKFRNWCQISFVEFIISIVSLVHVHPAASVSSVNPALVLGCVGLHRDVLVVEDPTLREGQAEREPLALRLAWAV